MEVHDPAAVTTIGAVATAATAAIGKLWYTVVEQHKDVKIALQDCEDEHQKAREKIDKLMESVAELKSEVGHMQGLFEGMSEPKPRKNINKGTA